MTTNEDSPYKEVSLSLRVSGDQEVLTRWLLTLQSPDKFVAIKGFDIQLDTKSKEKRPQAECNLTVAQWFNPESPETPSPTSAPAVEAPAPAPATPDGL